MSRSIAVALAVVGISFLSAVVCAADGNPSRGQGVFNVCAPCHSLVPNQNMTGPSLAGLWNRMAGGVPNFSRYSAAMKSSNIVWNDKTLEEWIKNPQHFVPGNEMTFAGVKDAQQRSDLIALLKGATEAGSQAAQQTAQMRGMMGGGSGPNLKKLDAEDRVQAIRYCGDTYRVTTVDGKTRAFWERNLRLKTDSSKNGPEKGAPALLNAGMLGDRADVIFAAPDEISGFIRSEC